MPPHDHDPEDRPGPPHEDHEHEEREPDRERWERRRRPDQSESEAYLFVVAYRDDTERKRVEYTFNTWDEGRIETPDGLVRLASDLDHEALYRDLLRKLPGEQVASYRLEALQPDVESETAVVERNVPADSDAVGSFLRYVIGKKKGSPTDDPNRFDVYTNKGRATVAYDLAASDDRTHVSVEITGHAAAPEYLARVFERELREFAASQG